jgi:hypothetical protein
LLAGQMNIEIVGGLIEQSIIKGMIDVLHNETNLMRHTLDAHEFGLRFMINSCYYTSMSPSHHVFTIGAKSNNLRSLACIRRIQNATNHGSNVLWCMTIVKGHCNQVQIFQGAIGTNADSDVNVRHRSMRGAISSKPERPHTRRAQDVWNALKIDGNTHADILVNNVPHFRRPEIDPIDLFIFLFILSLSDLILFFIFLVTIDPIICLLASLIHSKVDYFICTRWLEGSNVTTLSLGSQPRQGHEKMWLVLQFESHIHTPESARKCERMNPHTS